VSTIGIIESSFKNSLTIERWILATHMDKHERFSTNRYPLFDGSNYAFWSIRMRTYLMALMFDIWSAFKNGYIAPTTPPADTAGKRLNENNAKP
jgi:hypothetical protein